MKPVPLPNEDREVFKISDDIRYATTHFIPSEGIYWGMLSNEKVYCRSAFSIEMLNNINEQLIEKCEDILENIEHQLKEDD